MSEQTVITVPLMTLGPRGLASYIVTGDKPFLVDTGIPGSTEAILAALEAAGIAPSEIALIVITHAHPDHAGSAADLAGLTGAPVLAQRKAAEAIALGSAEPVVGRTPAGKQFAEQIAARRAGAPEGPMYAPVEVSAVVDYEADLAEYGIHGRVLHTPGHTSGDLTVLLGNGEALTGDLIGSESGAAALAVFAVDEIAMADSIMNVIALRPSVVYTAHDGSFELPDLLEAFDYLV
jgi:hydroxyacylglutathione hydrolase